jgi:hypothetical protein
MNAVAPTATTSSIAAFVPAPARLGAYIDAARRDTNIRPVPSDVQDAAWQHVRAAEALLKPATPTAMMAWLNALAGAVVNPPGDEDIKRRATAIWEVCSDLPIGVWCKAMRLAWCKTPGGKFWPAAGELYQHLADYAATIRNEVRGCEKILAMANQAAPQEDDPRKDPAQQESVRATMAAWRAEQAARLEAMAAQDRAGRPVTSGAVVSDETLLAIHERDAAAGNAASAMRAAGLRRKLGIEPAEAARASA